MSLQTALIANAVLDLLVLAALAAVFRPAFSGIARRARPLPLLSELPAANLASAEELAA